MALILKSSNFCFAAFRLVRKKNSIIHFGNRLNCFNLPNLPIYNFISNNYTSTVTKITTHETLEHSFYQLDQDAKSKQRIYVRDVEEILGALKQYNFLNYHNSLVLLKCCGNLFLNVEQEKRESLLKEAISLIENSDVKLSISHYNILLKAYIENEMKFSLRQFLSMLDQKNLAPDKITYQKLIKACCQQGDISGASYLLEEMRNQQMVINEDIFNSLIYGHGQANDMANAFNILRIMEDKGIEPSSETYLNLLCGYAKVGNLEKMEELFDSCDKKDIIFFDKDILHLAYVLAINEHSELVDKILIKLKKYVNYLAQARFYILKLLHKNCDSVAIKILKTTNSVSDSPDEKRRIGKYVIEYFVVHRPMEQVVDFCLELEKKELLPTASEVALKLILQMRNATKTLAMFSVMKSKNITIRPHYFWSFLIDASKKGNDALLEAVKEMRNFQVPLDFQTCTKIVFANYRFGDDWKKDLEILRRAGARKDYVAHSLFLSFLKEDKFEDALELASSMPVFTKSNALFKSIAEFLLKSKNAGFFAEILYLLLHDVKVIKSSATYKSSSESATDDFQESEKHDEDEFIEKIFHKIIRDADKNLLLDVLHALCERNIRVSRKVIELLSDANINFENENLIAALSNKDTRVEFDENILSAKKIFKSRDSREKSLDRSRIDELNDLIKSAENEEHVNTVARCKEFLNKLDRGLTNWEIKKLRQLLLNIAESGNFQAVEELYRIGVESNAFGPENFYPLVSALAAKEKLEEATDLFCQKVLETKSTSECTSFVTKLIDAKNANLLQKITDVLMKIKGESFTVAVLLSQFAKMKKIKEIKKLLDMNKFVLPKKGFSDACWWLFKNNSISGLETLLAATKEVPRINRTLIYNLLLKLYTAEGDLRKAESLWRSMEEEDIYPTKQFLDEFITFFQKNGEPVPFNVTESNNSNVEK